MRAMMTKSGSVRASTAALMRSTISSARHELLARPVAAALGADLVLDVHGRGAGLDQRPDRAGDVEGAAPKPVSTSTSSGSVADVGDAAHVGEHVVEVADAKVGHAQRPCGNAAAGQVDRAVAGLLGEDRVIGVDRAEHLQRGFRRKRGTQARPRREGRHGLVPGAAAPPLAEAPGANHAAAGAGIAAPAACACCSKSQQ